MRFISLLLSAIVFSSSAHAEWKKVSRVESQVLLVMPYLESGREVFEDAGWSSNMRVRSAYAAVISTNGPYPRAQVVLEQAAQLVYWKFGSDLDADWIKKLFPFFKDKDVRITSAAPQSDAFLRLSRFSVGATDCVAFEMRQASNPSGHATNPDARASISGVYCPPAGVSPTDELIQQVTEGIFLRRDGQIERARSGVNKPLPPKLM